MNDLKKMKHYNTGNIEVIDIINDRNLNFNKGNVIKYILRAGIKEEASKLDDLMKARNYIDYEIERIKTERGK